MRAPSKPAVKAVSAVVPTAKPVAVVTAASSTTVDKPVKAASAPAQSTLSFVPLKKAPAPAPVSAPVVVAVKAVEVPAPVLDLKARLLLKKAAAAAASGSGSATTSASSSAPVAATLKAVVSAPSKTVDLCSSDDEAFTVKGMDALTLNAAVPSSRVSRPVAKKSSYDEDEEEVEFNSEDEKPTKAKAVRKPKAPAATTNGASKSLGVKRPKKPTGELSRS